VLTSVAWRHRGDGPLPPAGESARLVSPRPQGAAPAGCRDPGGGYTAPGDGDRKPPACPSREDQSRGRAGCLRWPQPPRQPECRTRRHRSRCCLPYRSWNAVSFRLTCPSPIRLTARSHQRRQLRATAAGAGLDVPISRQPILRTLSPDAGLLTSTRRRAALPPARARWCAYPASAATVTRVR